jgi:general secretion pathway protein H
MPARRFTEPDHPAGVGSLASPLPRGAGFTLIELMVALTIGVLLIGASILGLGALTGTRARKALGELGAATRSLYDTAALTGNTCRLVFILPKEDSGEFSYRAECASGPVTSALDRDQELRQATKDALEAQKRRRTAAPGTGISGSTLLDLLDSEKERVEKAASFSAFTSPEIEPRKMSGVKVSVWTAHQRTKADTGLAYLYFFPQGYTERAQVTVRQGGNVWTLLVSPITGKTSIVDGEPELPKS